MPDTFTELLHDELGPRPDPAFAAEMDEWVANGFQRRRGPGWLESALRSVRTPLGMACVSTAVAAAVIAVLLIGDSAQQPTTSQTGADPAPALAQPSPEASSDSFQRSGGGIAPGQENRRIERSSQLTLAAPVDEFQSVGDSILKITDRHAGFVLRSNVSTGDSPSGDFQLRIPSDQLQATLRDLAALGDVRARSDTGQDVTREYVSVTDGLAAARAERRGLLRRLAAADDDAQVQRLRDRLDANAGEVGRLRAQVRDLRERTNYASVSVTLAEKKAGEGGGGTGGGGTGDALDDSLGLLLASFNWLLRALGVLIPAGLVGGAAWWAARRFRRHRREAVLF